MDLKRYFDRVVLINLKRRPDRLARITDAVKQCDWPFKWPKVFEAIDGNSVPCPDNWQSGGGAWGCMRSHQQIFERAIMDGIKSVLVLEDDACFADNFREKVSDFLQRVPDDWDQLMLGGQHINMHGTPMLVKPGVYKCTDCERTHCYAIRGEFMKRLYQRWLNGGEYNGEVHCDWIMGRDPELQRRHNVYAPERFLVGQDRGRSDINGGMQPRKFWNPPSPDLPVISLHAPPAVVAALRQYGIHTGYDRDHASDLDNGVIALLDETRGDHPALVDRLKEWISNIQWEVASDPFLICTVWHPQAPTELVRESSRWPVYEITASSLEEALAKIPPAFRRPRRPALSRICVVHLQAPKRVMDGLRRFGWHNGYWRDDATGLDRGLMRICADHQDRDQRVQALAGTIRILQAEADAIYKGVAVIWHPEIDADLVAVATPATVARIVASSIRDALDQWDEARSTLFQAVREVSPCPHSAAA